MTRETIWIAGFQSELDNNKHDNIYRFNEGLKIDVR